MRNRAATNGNLKAMEHALVVCGFIPLLLLRLCTRQAEEQGCCGHLTIGQYRLEIAEAKGRHFGTTPASVKVCTTKIRLDLPSSLADT